MVSRSQVAALSARIEEIAAVFENVTDPSVTVAVFKGEDPETAARRHLQLRPDHKGRRMKFEQRTEPRDKVLELAAVHSLAELEDVLRPFDGYSRSLPIARATNANKAK